VDIRRDPVTGEVVLSKPTRSWDDYFDWARTLTTSWKNVISPRTTCAILQIVQLTLPGTGDT